MIDRGVGDRIRKLLLDLPALLVHVQPGDRVDADSLGVAANVGGEDGFARLAAIDQRLLLPGGKVQGGGDLLRAPGRESPCCRESTRRCPPAARRRRPIAAPRPTAAAAKSPATWHWRESTGGRGCGSRIAPPRVAAAGSSRGSIRRRKGRRPPRGCPAPRRPLANRARRRRGRRSSPRATVYFNRASSRTRSASTSKRHSGSTLIRVRLGTSRAVKEQGWAKYSNPAETSLWRTASGNWSICDIPRLGPQRICQSPTTVTATAPTAARPPPLRTPPNRSIGPTSPDRTAGRTPGGRRSGRSSSLPAEPRPGAAAGRPDRFARPARPYRPVAATGTSSAPGGRRTRKRSKAAP